MTVTRGLIIRGRTEEEVREVAARLLESEEYDPCLAPIAVKGITGSGPIMMVVLEARGDGSSQE